MSESNGRIYFDWNSTTLPLGAVIVAINNAYGCAWANPASAHSEGRAARQLVEEARVAIAELVSGIPEDVIFTSGGTEASNLALRAPFATDYQGAIVLAPIEHPSVVAVAARLGELGVIVRHARVYETGVIDLHHLTRLLELGGVRTVAIQAVNAETGVIQPIEEVAAISHHYGARVHLDAIQAIGRTCPPPGGWLAHADSIAIASHKIRGPKGIGALVTRPGHPLRPILRGGSQERGLRPGTQDAALASGFGVAARHATSSVPEYAALSRLRDRFEIGLRALGNGVAINGRGAPRVPHVAHASFRGWTSPALVAALDDQGLAVSGGSACHAGSDDPSATLVAMWRSQRTEHWRIDGPVRFSLPPWTTDDDVDRALVMVRRAVGPGSASVFSANRVE